MLEQAFSVVNMALDGMMYFFMRLYDAFDLSLVVIPLLVISVSYSLVLRPMIGFANVTRDESIRARKKNRAAEQKSKSKEE